jgi:hypothetical protein
MKKLLVITFLLALANNTALCAADTSCRRLVDMLSEQPDLQAAFVATQEYQQCSAEKDAVALVTRSPKPEHALVVTLQLVQDGHKVAPEHIDQCMHAYWSARYQAGTMSSAWVSTTDQRSLQQAHSWMHHTQHYLAMAYLLTNSSANIRTMERFKKIDFSRIADERAHEMRLIERALQNS